MKYNPQKHHRRSIRLMGYDYSQEGAYFVTICMQNKESLFGEIVNGVMVLNEYGRIVEQCWLDLLNHYEDIELGEYVVMPNHFHGIVIIGRTENHVGANYPGTHHVGAIHELPQCESSPRESSQQNPSPNETNPDTRTNHDFPQRNLPPNEINSSHTIIRTHHVGAIHELPLRKPQHHDPSQQSMNDPIVRAIHELPQRNLSQQPTNNSEEMRIERRQMLLSKIIGRFKMNSAKRINTARNMHGVPVWQRNYYEHIIRNEASFYAITEYIINNPLNWEGDEYYGRV